MELNSTEFLATFLMAVSLYFPESGNRLLQPRDTPQTDVLPEYDFIIVGAGSAVSLYFPESGNPNLQYRAASQKHVLPEYDFIIVGAGSAGCVVANRLTENPDWNVLLLEAGGDEDKVSEAPRLQSYYVPSDKTRNYTTVKQERACLSTNGICQYPRGIVMGGSSTINFAIYVRGNKADYDGWAAAGNTGWSYEDVLPYFIKAENYTIPSLQNSPNYGHHGYQNVQHSRYMAPLAPKFIQAGTEFGWEDGNYNEADQTKMGFAQNTMVGPSRESTSKAYLNPIRNRPNLSVVKYATVSKLLIEGNVAKGVEYYRNDKKYTVSAKKEVIVSAGAIDTPKLLMLSGIGPKEELAKHNIPLKADLPVGEHLQDHVFVPIYFELGKNVTMPPSVWQTAESIKEYAVDQQGPLTTVGNDAFKFLNVLRNTDPPNIQIYFSSTMQFTMMPVDKEIITMAVSNIYPRSVGTVTLNSADWADPPRVNPNYFARFIDLEVLIKGVKLIFEYMKTPTMASLNPKLFSNFYTNCRETFETAFTYEYIKCIVDNYASSNYQPVSTARMGPLISNRSVVTNNLLVKGFLNLRVIDASVMPYNVRGNTNGPTIMIGEKGADIVKARYAYVG